MLYFCTYREQIYKRLPFKTLWIALVRVRRAIARSGSIVNGPNIIAYNTFGSILVILINLIVSSFRRLLT
jgi:hypothetical protein